MKGHISTHREREREEDYFACLHPLRLVQEERGRQEDIFTQMKWKKRGEEKKKEEYIYIPVLNHAVTRMNAHSSLKQSYILNDNNLFESYHPVYNDLWFVWVTFQTTDSAKSVTG